MINKPNSAYSGNSDNKSKLGVSLPRINSGNRS